MRRMRLIDLRLLSIINLYLIDEYVFVVKFEYKLDEQCRCTADYSKLGKVRCYGQGLGSELGLEILHH